MKVSFFPGCSLEGTAREYGESVEAVLRSLNVELEELPDWTCCGASSAHSTNEFLSIALPGRNLSTAENAGQDLITPCAACFSRLYSSGVAILLVNSSVVGRFDTLQGRQAMQRYLLQHSMAVLFVAALFLALPQAKADRPLPWPRPVTGWKAPEPGEHPRLFFRRDRVHCA